AALGRLSGGIGHELRAAVDPLLAGIGSLEGQIGRLLEAAGGQEGSDELKGSVQQTLAAVRKAGTELQALARGMQNSPTAAEPEPFDVNQAVLSAVQLLSHRLRTSVRLERNLEAVPMVRGRGPEITQVVLNLLGNAADAVERVPEPIIRVRTWHEGGSVRLEIADNGAGLDPDVAPKL